MTTAIIVGLIACLLLIATVRSPGRRRTSGWISQDKRGRILIALTPPRRKRRR